MSIKPYLDFNDLEIKYIGPDIEQGASPSVIYFSLCAQESLELDPFNQPALYLAGQNLRVFSITLPGHGMGFDKYQGMEYWANHLEKLKSFIEKAHTFVSHLDKQKLLVGPLATMGLSRGAFMALQIGTHDKVGAILGFAPVTDLGSLVEFKGKDVDHFALKNHYSNLMNKKVRCYIGNRDMRVQTAAAYQFTESLADFAYHQRIRSPSAELFIVPSVGQHGHGTLKPTFEEGASWLKKQIVE